MELTRARELNSEPAITVGERTLSYAELRGAAGAIAARLDAVDRVAVWADGTLESLVATVAAVEAGVELVPLNPMLGSAELEHVLSDARPEALAGAPGTRTVRGARRIAVDLEARAELPPAPRDPERVALVVYTSGTTGPPKGVLLTPGAIASNLDALAEAWAWTEADRLVHGLPTFHIHGLILGLFGPLRRGCHVRHLGAFSPAGVAAALAGGDTMVFGVPTMYHRLAELAAADPRVAAALAGARLLVSGSAPLPARTFERIAQLSGQRVVERYGLTETLIITAVRADGERRPGEVGTALPGVRMCLVTDEGDEAPPDGETVGEVVVSGPNLFRGYLNRPQATAEVLRAGWFWTGDLATQAPDGYLRIVGRRYTDLINTAGHRVGAGEVEGALLAHDAVDEAAVAGLADDELGERIAAWIVLAPGAAPPSGAALAGHVASLLAPHKRPREIHFVGELPRNAMGKVLKQQLTAQQSLSGA